MDFVLKYRCAIDQVTADKVLKLRKYELDNDDWDIVEDLVAVLEVRHYHLTNYMHYLYIILYRPTKRLPSIFLKTEQALRVLSRLWINSMVTSILA